MPKYCLSVLVVDDNSDVAIGMATLLRRIGHDAAAALSGEDALRLAAAVPPDVVLMDINMPGMNGYECAKGLRALYRDDPPYVVAVTGCDAYEARPEIDLRLRKPVESATLLRVLRERVPRRG